LYPACAEELYSDVVIIIFCNSSFIPVLYGFVPLETGFARDVVIASSWDYHGGAESRVSVRGNSGRFNKCIKKIQVLIIFIKFLKNTKNHVPLTSIA
jgi:hypothetical protein